MEDLFAIMPRDARVVEHVLTKLQIKTGYALFRIFVLINRKSSRMRIKYILCPNLMFKAIKSRTFRQCETRGVTIMFSRRRHLHIFASLRCLLLRTLLNN